MNTIIKVAGCVLLSVFTYLCFAKEKPVNPGPVQYEVQEVSYGPNGFGPHYILILVLFIFRYNGMQDPGTSTGSKAF